MNDSTSSKILQFLLEKETDSRVGLARLLKISRPAVSGAVDNLLQAGIVMEGGTGRSGGGKPPVLLSVNPNAFCVVGVDIGNEKYIRGVLCSAAGDFIAESEIEFENTFEDILKKTSTLIRRLKKKAPSELAGVGVAVSGIVDTLRGKIIRSANFPLENLDFAEKLSDTFALSVHIGNRSRMAAEYERCFGAARGIRDFIYLSAGKSIGSAIYMDGKLLHGFRGAAGEIRLFPVPVNGKMIPLEQALDEKNLLKNTHFHFLSEAAGASEIRDFVLNVTASATSVLADVTDPERIVLGGKFRLFGEPFLAGFRDALNRNSSLSCARDVYFAKSGGSGAVSGAALFAIRQKFLQY